MLDPAQLMGATGAKPQKPAGTAGMAGQSSDAAGNQAAGKARQGGDFATLGQSLSGEKRGAEGASSAARGSAIPEELKLPADDKSGNKGDKQSIGHEDFLKLMLTQLKNQDPMNPQDTEQMMGQIAQFTTASGVNELKSQFQEFFEHMRSDQSLRAAQLIGREVLTERDAGHLPQEGDFEAILQLDSSASNLTVEIANENGERVHREQLGQVAEGEHPYVWDGTNENGQRLPQGEYQLRAYREDGDSREAVGTLVGAEVTSVSMGKDGRPPELSVAGIGDVSLSEVKRVR